MWFVLIAVALIGIFALYISSGHIDTVSKRYSIMRQHSTEIKLKQNVILNVLNERLKSSKTGIKQHRELIEELAANNPDLKELQKEVRRIKRDENILNEAVKDLEHFKLIYNKEMMFENKPLEVEKLLKNIDQSITPYFVTKNNRFIYEYDANSFKTIHGDEKRIEQILKTIIIEMGNEIFDRIVTMNVSYMSKHGQILFSVTSDSKIDMSDFGKIANNEEFDEQQYSARILKNHIAKELIDLMGGKLSVIYFKQNTVCNLTLPA